jgi:hypothetical protein
MPAAKPEVATTNVRLDRALLRRLKVAAKRSLRTMNSEIELRLRQSFERPAEQPAPPAAA